MQNKINDLSLIGSDKILHHVGDSALLDTLLKIVYDIHILYIHLYEKYSPNAKLYKNLSGIKVDIMLPNSKPMNAPKYYHIRTHESKRKEPSVVIHHIDF